MPSRTDGRVDGEPLALIRDRVRHERRSEDRNVRTV